jgi:hypothetical protein
VCTARLARLGHRVWALEPIPDNFARLEGSLRLGGEGLDSRVARFNLGASDRTGERSAVVRPAGRPALPSGVKKLSRSLSSL